ncbi:MAG: cation:proton antiporter [Bdellovibrionales bacterium]|nr:cation:proton antiporter [Bdellovibrionales bacterium]
MQHLPLLIQDLGLILMAAAVVTLIFKKLRQPVVLGYLMAGFIVGPHFTFFPSVKDTANVKIWAEIGVIFMLFSLGLEFSFSKLSKVGKSASLTASVEILAMLGLGYLAGQLLGWTKMDSLFLGGILSISSTTIIVRALDELGLKGKSFVSLVFGVLIVEDLLAILLLVLLSSVAVTQSLSGADLAASSLKLVFFIVLWFLLGIYLLPILLKNFKSLLSDETMLIVSVGLCLMMVIIAASVGFSPALGAFVMGSLLAETPKARRVETLILPLKNLFSAIFFVSVGMLIDVNVISQSLWLILLLTTVTIVGKFLGTAIGALISGRSVKNSIQAGLSLAQIGEFSFIIATLGTTLKVTSDFLYPIAVAVSALTTFTTPYLIKYATPFYYWVEKHLPPRLKESLARYEKTISSGSGSSVLSLIWREYGIKIALNTVVVVAITLAMTRLALPFIGDRLGQETIARMIACAITFVLGAPFLWAIFLGAPSHAMEYPQGTADDLRRLQVGVSIFRTLIGLALAGFVVSRFTSIVAVSGVILIGLAAMGVFFFSRFSEPLYLKIERRFLSHLTANERAEVARKASAPDLAPWNATLSELRMTSSSPLIAKTLQESGLKEKFGVTIAMIERGGTRILAPSGDSLLLPGDQLFLIGTDEQLAAAGEVIEKSAASELPPISAAFGLNPLLLAATDPFVGKTIRDCGLREAVQGLIVGIEREGQRHLSPDSSTMLRAGDLVWIVGDRTLIRGLRTKTI